MKQVFQNSRRVILLLILCYSIIAFFIITLSNFKSIDNAGSNPFPLSEERLITKQSSPVFVSENKNVPICSNEFIYEALKENSNPLPVLEKLVQNCGEYEYIESDKNGDILYKETRKGDVWTDELSIEN